MTATVPLSLDIFCRGLLKSLSEDYEVIALSSPLPELDSIRQREGVRTIAVPMKRKVAPLHDLVSLFDLIRVFRTEHPHMVHSMSPKAGLLSMMAARATRVPVRIHTFTGLVFPAKTGLQRFILRGTDRITAVCATHVIPEGQGVKDDLLRFGVTKKDMKVLGNGNVRGIDLDYYRPTPDILQEGLQLRRSMGIPDEAFVFLFVGRFDRDKGLEELTSAFERLHLENPMTHLLLAGSQETEGSNLKEGVSEMIANHPAIHTSKGWISDVRPWYAAADAFVHPSYREGFPNVVIEAGAMGLASIVTDINGSREIIIEGKNGVIVPPHDADLLYSAMKSFASDRSYVRSLASNARPLVAGRYEKGFVQQCLKDFYKEVLK